MPLTVLLVPAEEVPLTVLLVPSEEVPLMVLFAPIEEVLLKPSASIMFELVASVVCSTNIVAIVGAAVPAAIVEPPATAICAFSEMISSLASL